MNKPKIGLLGLTLELYQRKLPGLMPKLEAFSRELKKEIENFAAPVLYPLAWNREKVRESFNRFSQDQVDGVVLVFLSYATSLSILPVLKKTKLPLLVWNTQKLKEIDTGFGVQELLENHGMHGVQDLASVLLREGVGFSLITGHYRDKKTLAEIRDWVEAAGAVTRLKQARIGRIAGRFPNMGDFSLEPGLLKKILGPATVELPGSVLNVGNIPAVKKAAALKNSLKAAAALKKLLEKERLSACTINFAGLGKNELMPFLAISKLMVDGFGYGGEGDVYSAAAVYLGQVLSGNQATFTEMFTTDYENSCIFMTHMGECNLALRRPKEPVRLVVNKMALGNNVPTTVPVFTLRPGSATLFNLTADQPNRLKLIISQVEVLNRKAYQEFSMPHFFIKPTGKVEEFLTAYSQAGGTHHLALVYGDIRRKLKFFCEIKNIPWVEI